MTALIFTAGASIGTMYLSQPSPTPNPTGIVEHQFTEYTVSDGSGNTAQKTGLIFTLVSLERGEYVTIKYLPEDGSSQTFSSQLQNPGDTLKYPDTLSENIEYGDEFLVIAHDTSTGKSNVIKTVSYTP